MIKILNFLFWPYQKKKLIFQSFFLVLAMRISLWVFPFRWINKWSDRSDSTAIDNGSPDWVFINDVAEMVKVCSRYIPYASCLTQALATQILLRLKGQETELKIGVDKSGDNELMAHAWIEAEGRIVIGKYPKHQRYLVLESSDTAVL